MSGPWASLALLFVVRAAMAFQYQSVGALAPAMMQSHGLSAADVGTLVALYFAPGVALAAPGGFVLRLIGDRRIVAASLLIMAGGAALAAAADAWSVQIAGRLASGVGGALLQVAMAKMIVEVFAGRPLATPMAIFINAWPFGLAAALLVLPTLSGGDVGAGMAVACIVAIAAFVVFVAFYRPASVETIASAESAAPQGRALAIVVSAGIVWGLYNAGLGMLFAFAPLMLVERGWTLAAASSATSLILWAATLSVPLGGVIVDRIGRPHAALYVSFIAMALAIAMAIRVDQAAIAFIIVGLVSGLPAGAAMSLPARALTPQTRAAGMGVFYTFYYCFVVAAPPLGGFVAGVAGHSGAALDVGAALVACACLFVLICQILSRPAVERRSAPVAAGAAAQAT